MKTFYENVPQIGSVRVTDHARKRALGQGISTEAFENVLFNPVIEDIPDGHKAVWRERNGIRIIITMDQRNGPRLVKTVFRVMARAVAFRR